MVCSHRPRPLQPIDLRRVAKPTIKKCQRCKRHECIPKVDDISEELHSLKSHVIEALRPLDIDAGKYERAQYGYRVHNGMIRFAWADEDVESKIAKLGKDREAAEAAFEYLMNDEDNAYGTFVEKASLLLEETP